MNGKISALIASLVVTTLCVKCQAFSIKSNIRREILSKGISGGLLTLVSNNANAAQTQTEAIRNAASKLPGYGSPDIFYPSSFVGKWKTTRVISVSDDPILSQFSLPLTVEYTMRFVSVDGDNNGQDAQRIVADRQYNEMSYYNAIRSIVESGERQSRLPSIRNVQWSAFNPNVCTTYYDDGSSKEVKVTKRATEITRSNSSTSTTSTDSTQDMLFVSSSEYRRITTDKQVGGIPVIQASRLQSKWRTSNQEVAEGIEVVYTDANVMGDPMMAGIGGSGPSNQPRLTSKSFYKLERMSSDI